MRATYDAEADALYIDINKNLALDRTIEIDDDRNVDIDADGSVVGIEVISPSYGFSLNDIIEKFDLEAFRSELKEIEAREYKPIARRPR
jgi:uncharacterized protein YuzE